MKEGHFNLRFKSKIKKKERGALHSPFQIKKKKRKKERKRGHLRIIQRLYTMRNDG